MIGVDVGETRVRVELFDLTLTELARAERPLTQRSYDVEAIVGHIRDGIAEVLEVMHPRQVALGRAQAPTRSVELVSSTGRRWELGAGPSVGTVTGPPAELLLLLWGRTPRTSPELEVSADLDALDALLAGHVTP